MKKIFILLLLLGVPIVLYYIWWLAEYNEYNPFGKMTIESTYLTAKEYLATSVLGFPQQSDSKQEYKIDLKEQNVSNLSQSISETFKGKMNFLPFIPMYRACLINRAAVYSEQDKINESLIEAGRIEFEQEGITKSLSANRGGQILQKCFKEFIH